MHFGLLRSRERRTFHHGGALSEAPRSYKGGASRHCNIIHIVPLNPAYPNRSGRGTLRSRACWQNAVYKIGGKNGRRNNNCFCIPAIIIDVWCFRLHVWQFRLSSFYSIPAQTCLVLWGSCRKDHPYLREEGIVTSQNRLGDDAGETTECNGDSIVRRQK